MSAMIRLKREASLGIELRRGPIEITIDGRAGGSINSREALEFPVGPGHHTLRLTAGRYSSREQSFEVSDGEIVNFRCHPVMVWPRYVASLVLPGLGISLRREE
ncbi:MAG: hypothetical protein WCD11_12440 [Solirubrobacteraceae bacterium]